MLCWITERATGTLPCRARVWLWRLCNTVPFQRHQATVRAVVYFPTLQAFSLFFFLWMLLYPFSFFLTPHALCQSFTSHLHSFYLPSLPRHFFLLSLLIPFLPPVCASLSLCLAFLQVQLLKSLSPFILFQVNTPASKAQNLPFQTSPKALRPTINACTWFLHKIRSIFPKITLPHISDNDCNKCLRSEIQPDRHCVCLKGKLP